jgi:hypothetical protein
MKYCDRAIFLSCAHASVSNTENNFSEVLVVPQVGNLAVPFTQVSYTIFETMDMKDPKPVEFIFIQMVGSVSGLFRPEMLSKGTSYKQQDIRVNWSREMSLLWPSTLKQINLLDPSDHVVEAVGYQTSSIVRVRVSDCGFWNQNIRIHDF